MLFLELTDIHTADLALELYFSGDCATLDEAASLAFAMQAVLADFAQEWDADAGYLLMDEGDVLGPDGLRAVP